MEYSGFLEVNRGSNYFIPAIGGLNSGHNLFITTIKVFNLAIIHL